MQGGYAMRKRYAKLLGLACLIGAMGLLPSSQSRAAGWLKDGNYWYYMTDDGQKHTGSFTLAPLFIASKASLNFIFLCSFIYLKTDIFPFLVGIKIQFMLVSIVCQFIIHPI